MSKKRKTSEEEGKSVKKEQKIIYIDDGSTVADMRGTYKKGKEPPPRSTFKERAATFFATMKKMIIPMFATLIAFTLVYILLLVATGKF